MTGKLIYSIRCVSRWAPSTVMCSRLINYRQLNSVLRSTSKRLKKLILFRDLKSIEALQIHSFFFVRIYFIGI